MSAENKPSKEDSAIAEFERTVIYILVGNGVITEPELKIGKAISEMEQAARNLWHSRDKEVVMSKLERQRTYLKGRNYGYKIGYEAAHKKMASEIIIDEINENVKYIDRLKLDAEEKGDKKSVLELIWVRNWFTNFQYDMKIKHLAGVEQEKRSLK